MFWLRQHVLPLVEGFQERETSPGAESFRSALSDGAESFYSALSGHRSSVYYDAESSDLNSSDSDSRYCDADEDFLREHTPEIATELKGAVSKEGTLDEAYESFSYGKIFEDVYGSVVHRPPLLSDRKKRQDNKTERQPPPRKWRPPLKIAARADLSKDTAPRSVHGRQSVEGELLPTNENFIHHVEEECGMELAEPIDLSDKMQNQGSIGMPFFCLEQVAEEFSEFIVEEAKQDACRFMARISGHGNQAKMPKDSVGGISNDDADSAELVESGAAVASKSKLDLVTSQDRDILDAFNKQFEPCFDSEEEPDSQVFENASEEELDLIPNSNLEERGLLNKNALLGTFKRFPQSTFRSLPHVHSFSDCSVNASPKRCASPLFHANGSDSELTEKYWRRHSSDIADNVTQHKKSISGSNAPISYLDGSNHSCLNLSNGNVDSTADTASSAGVDATCISEPTDKAHCSVEVAHPTMHIGCPPLARFQTLSRETQSDSSPCRPSRKFSHGNKNNMPAPVQEKSTASMTGCPKPPPRSPRDTTQRVQCPESFPQSSGDRCHCCAETGKTEVKDQTGLDSELCSEGSAKVPLRRKKSKQRPQPSQDPVPKNNSSSEASSEPKVSHQFPEANPNLTNNSAELSAKRESESVRPELFHEEKYDESDEDLSFSSSASSECGAEPEGEMLRLPFSLAQLTGKLFEDDCPLDIVSFHVVDNCDFLNDTCGDDAQYMVKLGPNNDLSAFLVDPDTSEHSELEDDSDFESVFGDSTSLSFQDSYVDCGRPGSATPEESYRENGNDLDLKNTREEQLDSGESGSNIPTRPKRKLSRPLPGSTSPATSSASLSCDAAVEAQKKTDVKLASLGATASDNVADALTDETCAPGVIQLENDCFAGGIVGTDAVSRSSASAEAGTRREKDALKQAAVTLSCSVTPPPPPSVSGSYQETPEAGVGCDKPDLDKTRGSSFPGTAAVASASRANEHGEMVSPSVDESTQLINDADIRTLKKHFLEAFREFGEEQKPDGSPGQVHSAINDVHGQASPAKELQDKGTSSSSSHAIAKPLGQTLAEVEEMANRFRGIQGHHNSCYLDATLFAMFACTYTFDDILNRPRDEHKDIKEYEEIQRVLRDDIVQILRTEKYVPHKKIMRLRHCLDALGGVKGLTTEEKDPEEFLNSLFYALRVEPFLKLSSGQDTHLYQLFVEKNEALTVPTVQQLFHQSIHDSNIKLKEIPKALIIQMPRFGKQFKLYDHIVPSLELDITDALEKSPRFCFVCGREACLQCRDCFQPDVGLESTSYCDDCSGTAHKHRDRETHMPTKLPDVTEGAGSPFGRTRMTLFAVVCIETSHYVCFVKCPVGGNQWCFFDSMADREGGEDGQNIPNVARYMEANVWLGEGGYNKLITKPDSKLLPNMTRRLFCDAYMCMYESKFANKYS